MVHCYLLYDVYQTVATGHMLDIGVQSIKIN